MLESTTYLAAHALPPDREVTKQDRADDYIEQVCAWLPILHATEGLVDAVDGFCENIPCSVAIKSERRFRSRALVIFASQTAC